MSNKPEFTGKNVNYYLVDVKEPKRLAPYQAECEDIIEALGMTFAEGCAFKAIWRSCAARTLGLAKKGQDAHGVYDAEKVEYYGARMVACRKKLKAADQPAPVINITLRGPSEPEIRKAVEQICVATPDLSVPDKCPDIRFADPVKSCSHVFRDPSCNYKKGHPMFCDKSIDFCNSINNVENFGSHP